MQDIPTDAIPEADEDEGYHMGVYLNVNIEAYEFEHKDAVVLNLKEKYNYYMKQWNNEEQEKDNISFVLFLGEAKHKIKKKAEQEACRLALCNLK